MASPCRVKLCGTTTVADAQMASQFEADYSGVVVEIPFSERSVTVQKARLLTEKTAIPTVVLVFDQPTDWIVDAIASISPFAVQLLGHETPDQVSQLRAQTCVEIWKSLFMPIGDSADLADLQKQMAGYTEAGVEAILLDTVDLSENRFGGTGKTGDWQVAAALIANCPITTFLSGGINPQNVKEAIQTVQPDGIDLCSGVEKERGKRDIERVRQLMAEVNKS